METARIEALLVEIKELAKAGKMIMADGKIDMADLGEAVKLLSRIPKMIEAAKGASEALEEAKDLEAAELIHLVEVLAKHVKEVEQA